jgi:hypothetical protein
LELPLENYDIGNITMDAEDFYREIALRENIGSYRLAEI